MNVSEISDRKPSGSQSETRSLSVRQQRRLLTGDLDNIVLKALRKEPSRRYTSAEQLSEDIWRHLEGLPVTATPDSVLYRTRKFVQRHTFGVAAAALILIAIAAGIYTTMRQARIAEANRRRAEARFNDVRKLANSLIFEVSDSLATLPGAGKARHIILQRAVEYLDSLSKESANEPDLQRELSVGYERIGALQGDPLNPNLGDLKGAVANMQKALAIRESLARSNPNNHKDQVDLAIIYVDLADFESGAVGDPVGGFEYCKKAVAILDREEAADPNNLRTVLQNVRAYSSLGFLQVGNGSTGTVGTVKEGIEAAQHALLQDKRAQQLAPASLQAQGQEAVIDIMLGDSMLKLGDRPQALEYFQHGLNILNHVGDKANNIIVMLNSYVVMSKIGDVFLIQRNLPDAIKWYTKDQQGAERLSSIDPANETIQRLVITSSGQLGHALMEVGRIDEGLKFERIALAKAEAQPSQTPLIKTFQAIAGSWIGEAAEKKGNIAQAANAYKKSQEIFRTLRANGTNDLRMQVNDCSFTDRLAAALLKSGKPEEAEKEYESSRAVLEPLLQANPDNVEVKYALAETYTGEGNVAAQLARRSSRQAERATNWSAAVDSYQKSLSVWSGVPNPAWISTSLLEVTLPADVSRRLAECRAQRSKTGMNDRRS